MPIGGILIAQQNTGGFGVANPVQYSPEDKPDLAPSDVQPAGVDEEKEPQSLEEALVGWIVGTAPQSRTVPALAFALQGGYH